MLKGLRKRETYEELINELGEDPIKKYPDRRATNIENSNFMSQLASGFQEVIEQNNRILKEKTKELLLQEATASSGVSHKQLSIQKSSHSPSIVPDYDVQDADGDVLYSAGQNSYVTHSVRQGERGFTTNVSPTIHIPARTDDALLTQLLRPDIHMSSTSSSSARRKPQMFDIADDIDDEIKHQHQDRLDDIELQEMHDDSRLQSLLQRTRSLLHEVQSTPIGGMMMSGPEQLQRSTSGTKREQSPASEGTKPKSKAKPTPKKFSRPNPEADNEPERTAKKQKNPKDKEDPKRAQKVLKTDNKFSKEKPKHDTDKVVYEDFNEWNKKGKGFLIDQIYKRPTIKITKTDSKKMHKKELIEKLLSADGKL